MERRAHTMDTVRLLRDWEGWPAGTVGAVITEHPETALVEVVTEADVDEHGLPTRDLLDDLITVPYSVLDVVKQAPATAR